MKYLMFAKYQFCFEPINLRSYPTKAKKPNPFGASQNCLGQYKLLLETQDQFETLSKINTSGDPLMYKKNRIQILVPS